MSHQALLVLLLCVIWIVGGVTSESLKKSDGVWCAFVATVMIGVGYIILHFH